MYLVTRFVRIFTEIVNEGLKPEETQKMVLKCFGDSIKDILKEQYKDSSKVFDKSHFGVRKLMDLIYIILKHGLKSSSNSSIVSIWSFVYTTVPKLIESSREWFDSILSSKTEYTLDSLSRSWIIWSLNDKKLYNHLGEVLLDCDCVNLWYYPYAILGTQENASIVVNLLALLDAVNISIKDSSSKEMEEIQVFRVSKKKRVRKVIRQKKVESKDAPNKVEINETDTNLEDEANEKTNTNPGLKVKDEKLNEVDSPEPINLPVEPSVEVPVDLIKTQDDQIEPIYTLDPNYEETEHVNEEPPIKTIIVEPKDIRLDNELKEPKCEIVILENEAQERDISSSIPSGKVNENIISTDKEHTEVTGLVYQDVSNQNIEQAVDEDIDLNHPTIEETSTSNVIIPPTIEEGNENFPSQIIEELSDSDKEQNSILNLEVTEDGSFSPLSSTNWDNVEKDNSDDKYYEDIDQCDSVLEVEESGISKMKEYNLERLNKLEEQLSSTSPIKFFQEIEKLTSFKDNFEMDSTETLVDLISKEKVPEQTPFGASVSDSIQDENKIEVDIPTPVVQEIHKSKPEVIVASSSNTYLESTASEVENPIQTKPSTPPTNDVDTKNLKDILESIKDDSDIEEIQIIDNEEDMLYNKLANTNSATDDEDILDFYMMSDGSVPIPDTFNDTDNKSETLSPPKSERKQDTPSEPTPVNLRRRWVPPKKRVYFEIHIKRTIEDQLSQCAGCQKPITKSGKIFGDARYCYYSGKYYCKFCHVGDKSYIPSYILHRWDFTKRPVSKFYMKFLNEFSQEPIFEIETVNFNIYSLSNNLKKVRALKICLGYQKNYIVKCKAKEALLSFAEQQLPQRTHLIFDNLYSLRDLIDTQKGLLLKPMIEIQKQWQAHILSCTLCKSKGYFCEICKSQEIIFPFQVGLTKLCRKCKTLYHRNCYIDVKKCLKCERIKKREANKEQNSKPKEVIFINL